VLSVDGLKLDRFYVIICINATQLQEQFIIHFLLVSSGFYFHTHVFRSLLRIFYELPTVHVTSVTLHQYALHHGYNSVAGDSGAGSHLLHTNRHSLPTKYVEKVAKLKYYRPILTLRPPPDQEGDVCKVWFRSVQIYGVVLVPYKQTFIFIYKIAVSCCLYVFYEYYYHNIYFFQCICGFISV
jgi:hypothetical protein